MKIFVLTIHNPSISMGPNMRLQGFLKNTEKSSLNYILPPFKSTKKHSKIYTLSILIKSFSYLLQNHKKIDLIHVVTPPSYPGLIAVFLKKTLKLKYIVDVGDPYAENMALIKNLSPKSFKFRLLKYIDKVMYKNASHLILTSPELDKYTNDSTPKTTILTGIDKKDKIQGHPLPNNKKCLYIGQYGPLQNLDYIIEVFATAIKKDKNISLHIIGQGEKQKIENLIKKLDLEKNIKLFNPIQADAIPSLIQKYTCGIVSLDLKSSLDYAIPTKLLTYLAHGLPVFGTGGTATKSVTLKANAGKIITSYNLDNDSRTLLNLLNNKENLQNYSKNAIKFAKENLSIENCTEKATQIYKNA